MKSPIAIIDCATHEPSHQCFNQIIENFNLPMTYHATSTMGVDSLKSIKESSGYIIFGSDSNVCDRLNWQIDLAGLMKDKIIKGIPVLGICFGHQLMADAFGATIDLVTPDNKCFEGVRTQKLTKTKFGFTKTQELTLFISHHYEVKNLPQDFEILGESDICAFDALSHKSLPYFSVQGHPEASMRFVDEHLEVNLSKEDIQKGMQGGQEVIKNFIDLVKLS